MPEILILQKETPRFQGHISQPYLNSPRKTFFFPKTSLQRLVYLLLLPGWETPKFHLNQFPLALFLVSKKDMPQNAVTFVKTTPSLPILSPFSQPLALYLHCLDLDFPIFVCVGQSAGMRNLLAQGCTLSIGQSNSAFIRSASPGKRSQNVQRAPSMMVVFGSVTS